MRESEDDLLRRVKAHVEPELSDRDVERLVRGAAERRQGHRVRRSLGVGLALGAVGATLIALFLRLPLAGGGSRASHPAPSAAVAAHPPAALAAGSAAPHAPEAWTLSDQSRATALARDTKLEIEEDLPARTRLRMDRGHAHFDVTERPGRAFSVRAGSVTVSVVGTVFNVEVVADRVGVSVERGGVEVDWGLGHERLLAGQSGWFPPLLVSGNENAWAEQPAASPKLHPAGPAASTSVAGPTASAASSAQELLAASDAARSRGDAELGAELLRRVLREHPNDPRAPLAAFTLGRVLLTELGRPREAATAFREVERRAPGSQFAEDALAREVEAWVRASEPARARTLAKTYLERYPSGRHVRRVKALSGLD